MYRNSVIAVIVTYNRLQYLQQCIKHICAQTVACDILIVDNASNDGTSEWAKQQAGIQYINTGKNIGGAGGFNVGLKKIADFDYSFAWLMDDDTMPEKQALEKLLEAHDLLHGEYGWLSSVALWIDGLECKMNRQKLVKSYYKYSHFLKYGIVEAEQATFVSLFLSLETVYNVGLPIKEFFIWGDDIEYTRRIAKREKLPCFVVGQSQVIHAMKDNEENDVFNSTMDKLQRYRYSVRNEAFLFRKEGLQGMLLYHWRCTRRIIYILKKSRDHRIKRILVVIGGMLRGLFFRPCIELLKK